MPTIIPISRLINTSEFSALVHASSEPIFVTKNGYGDMAVLSMELWSAEFEGRGWGQAVEAPSEENLGRYVAALKAMDLLMRNANDERVSERWLAGGVPDGATEEDYESIAGDAVGFEDCCNLFIELMGSRELVRGGFCFE